MVQGKELSAFERKRLDNIATNRALLTDIAASVPTYLPPPSARKSGPKPQTRPRRSSRTQTAPASAAVEVLASSRTTRASSRLAGRSAGNDVKRKLDQTAETQAEPDRTKRARVNEDIELGDMAGLGGLGSLQVRGAQPGVRTWDDGDGGNVKEEDGEDEKDEKGIRALRKRLGGLRLYERWTPNEIKIVPQRVYALGFHPTDDKPIIFAGDKDGSMGVFDASQPGQERGTDDDDDDAAAEPAPVISVFRAHARTVTSFAFSPADLNVVYSASYDSSIRKVDLQKGVSTQVYVPVDADEDRPISALEIAEREPNVVLFSTLDGDLGRHDLRASIKARSNVWTLSQSKIGGFSLHPGHPHLIATASLDRTMKIWDLRKIVDGVPALLGAHLSRLSVSHAAWSEAGHVATTSYDDTIKIYSFGDAPSGWTAETQLSDDELAPVVVRHNNQTGRWVSILKPQWQRHPRDGIQRFVVANMNRFVDVFASDGSQLGQFDGDGITAVPAVAQFHPTMDWVAGGTGSGKLCLWM